MALKRILGSDSSMVMTGPNGMERGFGAVKSFEWTIEIEPTEEGYIGEITNRFGEVLGGYSGAFEFHFENANPIAFYERVTNRIKENSNEQFSFLSTFQFPDGVRQRVNFANIFFGNLPVVSGGKAEYVNGNVTWKGSSVRFLT